ncbi:MAG: ABC transporter permease [Prolixibacteraceae bacterium]|nr:ABC transporter permease [Prolixibacteraceae bacterium]
MTSKIRHYIDIATVLLQKDLKVRYKSTLFGYLWSVGHPLAFALVFFIAFKVVMKIQIDNYALFLIAGLFPWQWLSNSMNASPTIFLANWTIIKKINFPRNMLPFTLVLQDMVHYILSIPVIVLFLYIYRKTPSLNWLYGVPLLLVMQFSMVYGLSLIISSINLFFRDLERLTTIGLTLLFYFTPVIYPETMIPDRFKPLLTLNPFAHLIVNWRNLLLDGTIQPILFGINFAYSLLILWGGYMIYRKLCWRFAEVL